jgi:hypothetical protein
MSSIIRLHSLGLQVHGRYNFLDWNTRLQMVLIWSAISFDKCVAFWLLKLCHQKNSFSFRQRGWRLYGNSLFNFSFRSLQPQSSPAINLTSFSIPVALVTFAIVSPNPCDGLFFGDRFAVTLIFSIVFIFN